MNRADPDKLYLLLGELRSRCAARGPCMGNDGCGCDDVALLGRELGHEETLHRLATELLHRREPNPDDLVLTMRPTAETVMLRRGDRSMPVRLWRGEANDGTPVHALVASVSPQTHETARLAIFDRVLELTPEAVVERPLWPGSAT